MISKILILRFPVTEVQKPIICHLAKDYDLTFNILHATVFPRKEGMAVIELSGRKGNFQKGIDYLKGNGVHVDYASQDVERDEEKCIQCGACTAVCPTGALFVKRPEMSVEFDQEKCSICQLCITACPTRAMVVRPKNGVFFE